jgi:hypothetical protein
MAFKTISTMMIAEILRRWHRGHSISTISLNLRDDRKTIREAYLTDRDNKLKPKSVYEMLCENNETFSRNLSYSSFKRYIRNQK